MRILLLGSGGREHALAWKLNQSVWTNPLYIAPGNPGTAECGINVPLDLKDFDAIATFCISEGIEMLVVGPEEPLVNGLYDHFKADPKLRDIYFIGPSRAGAQLEGSKAFAKAFMNRHGIPTAGYQEFTADNFAAGVRYIESHSLPVVLKADGLAAGKGVIICQSHLEAVAEFELMLQHSKFGEASRKVVVEEFLSGIELSVFVITDGKSYLLLPEAKDYKRVGEGDTGLNTGGMGAISPVPFATPAFMKKIEDRIIGPTIAGLHQENVDYVGFLFFGLISVQGEPYVIEYNCRLGDPETEVILPRLESDLVGLLIAATQQELFQATVRVDERAAATVVAVSKGYPMGFEKGLEIAGLEQNFGKQSHVFHAGTRREDDRVVTNGGRVLCVTSLAPTLQEAVQTSLDILEQVDYENKYYRTDIGYEFIDRQGTAAAG
ncbi:MAG TPA: phosphoribosylamine--glycine ligase [Chitinophagaceae bacterium]|nr:phosphoribosylamine--glycine ligase [Chitinophagaceae bacterium]